MHKKSIVLIITVIILILLIFLSINFFKFNKIYNKIKENYNITNFKYSEINNSNIGKNEIVRRDDTIICKVYSEENIHIFTFYYNGEDTYIFHEINKKYTKESGNSINGNKYLYKKLEFSEDDLGFLGKLKMFISTKISNEEKDGIESYHIVRKHENEKYEYYINSDDYLPISSDITSQYTDYEINTITNEDVKMPNIDEYEYKENIQEISMHK